MIFYCCNRWKELMHQESTLIRWLKIATGCFLYSALLDLSHSQTLPEILERVLLEDPLILEIRASQEAAQAKLESSQAQYWPKIGISTAKGIGGSSAAQDAKPVLTGTVNLFAAGGMQAQVRSDEYGLAYWAYKLEETQDQLAYKVATLYLEALKANDAILVIEINLERHRKITKDLSTIARYDVGRQSDLLQAQARSAQVYARLLALKGDLEAAQSRLEKYSKLKSTNVSFEKSRLEKITPTQAARDVEMHPTYLAQQQEVQRTQFLVDVTESQRWPRLNLESSYSRNGINSRLALSWDFYDRSSTASIKASQQQVLAARAKLNTVQADLLESQRTAKINLEQALKKEEAAISQLGATEQVSIAYEKQFQIARRSLIDLLNAYADLANVELAVHEARQDKRAAQLQFAFTSNRLSQFVLGVEDTTPSSQP